MVLLATSPSFSPLAIFDASLRSDTLSSVRFPGRYMLISPNYSSSLGSSCKPRCPALFLRCTKESDGPSLPLGLRVSTVATITTSNRLQRSSAYSTGRISSRGLCCVTSARERIHSLHPHLLHGFYPIISYLLHVQSQLAP